MISELDYKLVALVLLSKVSKEKVFTMHVNTTVAYINIILAYKMLTLFSL